MKKTNSSQRVAILTMGCRVNQFETDLILKMGSDHGHDTTCSLDKAGIIIINTCSVTRESERQARKLIRKLGRDYPDARLVVTGCYAQRSPETFANQPNVDLVLGNGDKKNLWNFWNRHRQNHPSTDPFPISMEEGGSIAVHGPILDHSENRARASLQIQDGCDRKCTYCLIPQVRGPGVSMEARRILQQAASYLDSGSRELVLLGIDIGAYGRDLSPVLSLSAILNMLIPLCQNARLRLSSIDPMDLNDELLELFAPGSPLCPHLHLSIQSGDDLIRKRMGRHGQRRDILKRIDQLRRINPNIALGADLIAGFPTESEMAFANTLAMVQEGGLSLLHVFPYSERPNTPAARFPRQHHVPDPVIRQRAALLRQAGKDQLHARIQQRLLYPADVLVEQLENGYAIGTSEDYFTVRFIGQRDDSHGCIRRVRLVEYDPIKESFEAIVPQLSTDLSTGSVDNL